MHPSHPRDRQHRRRPLPSAGEPGGPILVCRDRIRATAHRRTRQPGRRRAAAGVIITRPVHQIGMVGSSSRWMRGVPEPAAPRRPPPTLRTGQRSWPRPGERGAPGSASRAAAARVRCRARGPPSSSGRASTASSGPPLPALGCVRLAEPPYSARHRSIPRCPRPRCRAAARRRCRRSRSRTMPPAIAARIRIMPSRDTAMPRATA